MYHLLKDHHKPRLSQGMYYPLNEDREPPTKPGNQEPHPDVGATENQEPGPEAAQEPEPVYTVIGEPVVPEEDTDAITIVLDTHPELSDHQQDEEPSEPKGDQWPVPPVSRRRHFIPLGWMLVGVALVLAGVLVVTQVLPWWETSAIVTIVPVTRSASATLIVHLVPGNADPAHQQIQGRQLATLTMSQSKTVAATGNGYQPAQAAQGWITLFNALPAPQIIPAGTLILGQDRVQVTSDSTVTIPAANLPIDGQVSVSAHATEPGPAGNIAALDIDGPCCRNNVFAKNPVVFTGGQNARSFQAVSAQDIQGASIALETVLTQDVTAAYQAELVNGESLIIPAPCGKQVQSDYPKGVEAKHVTVTVMETCQGMAYNTLQMQILASQALNQKRQAGAYQLNGLSLHIHLTPSNTHPEEVQVQAQGTMVYQWSQQQQKALVALIAGKNEAQAITILLQQPGISHVSITLAGRDTGTLPGNASRIQFTVVGYNSERTSFPVRIKIAEY